MERLDVSAIQHAALGALGMLTLVLIVLLWQAVGALKWAWRWVRTHHEISSKATGGVVEVSAKLGDHLAPAERRDPHKTTKALANGGGWSWPKDPQVNQEGPPS
jgi:hypothetical protein